MSDHDRAAETLTLLARSGAYEVLSAMYDRGGSASFAQISEAFPYPVTLLRSMAAAGFVVTPFGGTLDGVPGGETYFSLTAKGEAIFGHLMRLGQWITRRDSATPRSSDR